MLGCGLNEASCCLFDRISEVVKHKPTPAIHMGKHLGWDHKLGGAESLGISKAGLTVLPRCIESQMWHQSARFRKGKMASVHPDARNLSSSLYATGAFQAATPILELSGSKSE